MVRRLQSRSGRLVFAYEAGPCGWVLRLEQQRGHNKAAIALANKLARIVWAVWHRDPNPKALKDGIFVPTMGYFENDEEMAYPS